jgi:hypothetical protein
VRAGRFAHTRAQAAYLGVPFGDVSIVRYGFTGVLVRASERLPWWTVTYARIAGSTTGPLDGTGPTREPDAFTTPTKCGWPLAIVSPHAHRYPGEVKTRVRFRVNRRPGRVVALRALPFRGIVPPGNVRANSHRRPTGFPVDRSNSLI